MKKNVFLCLFIALHGVLAAQKGGNAPKFNTARMELNGFIYTIDPRIELYNVLSALNGSPFITPEKLKYKEEVLEHFATYSNLPSAQHFLKTLQGGWDLSAGPHFFLHLDENLNYVGGLDTMIVNMSGGIENVQSLAKDVKQFADESGFYQFYNEHLPFYNLVLANAKYNFSEVDERERLERFYGMKNASYTVVLNILEGSGNFGVIVGDNLYALIGCETVHGDIPSYSPDYGFYGLVYHEFSHSFCNPLVYANGAAFMQCSHLFDPIKTSLEQQGYNNWLTAVHEHLVRASTVMLAEDKFGKEIAELKFYRKEIGARFIYVEPLMEKLREYLQNRSKYKDYKAFFPEIIKTMQGITEAQVKELEPKIFMMRKPDVEAVPMPRDIHFDSTLIVVLPTNERNAEANKQVTDYAMMFAGFVNGKPTIVTDKEALGLDLSQHDLLVVGTVQGNLFLQKHIKDIPLIIKDDYLIAKEKLLGSEFQFTLTWLNPDDPKRLMWVLSAQKPENIKEFEFSFYKEQYHYWIARNHTTIVGGNFSRQMEVWGAY